MVPIKGDQTGCVYFVQAVDGGPIKIGLTMVTSQRSTLQQVQRGNPRELRMTRLVKGGRGLENLLHRHFKAERIRTNGEWFEPSDRLCRVARTAP